MSLKVWMWDHEPPTLSYIMLLVEDELGRLHGITFAGAHVPPEKAEVERGDLRGDRCVAWRRLA